MASLGTPIYVSVRAIADKFGPDLNRALSRSRGSVQRNGEDLGKHFMQGFNRGIDTNAFRRVSNGIREMVPEAEGARRAFQSLVRTGYTLGTALTVVVGGISAAVSGLVALVGAAGGAASTVVVLGNAFFALGAGMISARLALGGVGAALGRLNKQTTASASTATRSALSAVRDAQAREAATRRIEDAERSLARLIEDNAERLIQANRDIADAQSDLNRAIRDGREELQQLGFDAEDAALNEQRAAIALEKARETLAKVQDLPPNNRARREAELAFAEAELNYRRAKDANADIAAEQDRLAKSGVNGLASVIAARNRLAKAEEDKADTIKNALESEEDALRNLEEARRNAANVDDRQDAAAAPSSAGAGGTPWDEGLNQYQRDFVLFLHSLKPLIDELKLVASAAFLPQLEKALDTLATKAFPTIRTGVEQVADAMGRAAITLADIIVEEQNLQKLANLFESSGTLIDLMASAFGRLYDITLSWMDAASPMAEEFFGFLDQSLTDFAAHLNSEEGRQELIGFFEKANETAKLFGDVLGGAFGAIGAMINANLGEDSGGGRILAAFAGWLDRIGEDEAGLKQFFDDVATNTIAFGGALSDLFGVLKDLATNPNIAKTFEILRDEDGVAAFSNIMQETADAGPALAELIVTITEIVSALTDTGSIQAFFDTLNNITGWFRDFVSDPGVKSVLDVLGRIFATLSALGLVMSVASFGFKVLAGVVMALLKPFILLNSAWKVLVGWKIKDKIETALLHGMYAKDAVLKGAAAVKTGVLNAATKVGNALRLAEIKQGAVSAAMWVKDAALKAASAAKTLVLTGAQKAAAAAQWLFNAAMNANPIGIVVAAIAALVAGLVWFFTQTELGQEIWKNFTQFLTEAWTNIVNFATDVWNNLASFFTDLWEGIVTTVESVWKGITGFFDGLWNGIVDIFNWVINFIVDLFLNWTVYGLIIQHWDAIVAFFGDVWDNIMGFFDAAFQWIDQYVIQPFNRAITVLGDVFNNVGKFIGDVWENIRKAIDKAWKWIDTYIFKPIRDAVELIAWAFENSELIIAAAWQMLQDNLNAVWLWIDDHVFHPIREAVNLVQEAFENVADGIATAWEGIKKAAAVPVNFVIETVYNNGIRSFWNDIAGNLGMDDLKLPKVNKIAFASGGVLPGYTPGRDVHRFYSPTGGLLHLSGGEAIMRPEWTRAVGGPKAVERMNRAARGGKAFATGGVYGTYSGGARKFASGGVLDFAGDVLDNITKFARIVGDFFVNPMGAVKTHLIDGLITPLMSGAGDNMFTKLIGGIPVKIAEGVGSFIAKFFESEEGAGRPANALGWNAMWNVVKTQFPWANLNSAYRPGAITATGSKSYHGKGRAIDVTPSMDIFNFLARAFPNSSELIYSPANGRQLRNGKRYNWGEPVRGMHFDHVHWAMAKGGTVYPTPDGTIVRVAEAGQPERVEPLDPNGLSDRDKALIDHLTGGHGETTINVYQQPGEDGEALAEKISRIISRDMRLGSVR